MSVKREENDVHNDEDDVLTDNQENENEVVLEDEPSMTIRAEVSKHSHSAEANLDDSENLDDNNFDDYVETESIMLNKAEKG